MKMNESISNVKKEIKILENELVDISGQLGGVFFDSELTINGSNTIKELNSLQEAIPQIKNKMEEFRSYNLSIVEAQENIKECNEKVKDSESKLGSIYEKIGVELYCLIGVQELAYPAINNLYVELKENESKSEVLNNNLYKIENNSGKGGILTKVSKPFKIQSIKREIKQTNKVSLKKFRALGKSYCEIPQLINQESNESLLDVVDEYNDIIKNIKHLKDKCRNLENRIKENEHRIKEGSNGVRLKSLYNKFEEEIIANQNKISDKLVVLGVEIAEDESINTENPKIISKLENYKKKKDELENKKSQLAVLEKKLRYENLIKEINERKQEIGREEDHIKACEKKLNINKQELELIEKKVSALKSELNL